ncbi:MAG: transrane protein [Ramlibacter sp.]|jgi:Tfp pilus assembly protein PilO|nr:transrane protein [Ramlibacter sp.]
MTLHLPPFMRRRGMRLGWAGMCGIGALALGLAVQVAILAPAHERVDAARAAVASMQQRLAAGGTAALAARPLTLEEQLAQFYAAFPEERDAATVIARIALVARGSGLVLEQADYKAERDKALKLTRMQMNLPLHGSYSTIRQFLSGLRAELPFVSVEQVQLERQKVGDAAVDARIRLVIYLGVES